MANDAQPIIRGVVSLCFSKRFVGNQGKFGGDKIAVDLSAWEERLWPVAAAAECFFKNFLANIPFVAHSSTRDLQVVPLLCGQAPAFLRQFSQPHPAVLIFAPDRGLSP